ncbi:hypothetical protein N473_18115 [Pseudoalteromonas luteoviolacea CPMOR-1]|uniref:Uncharacterized protein n=1 Tax=Pseudoalteromonas luteoviolacea CPMOR-1 TaxID=1365248 RepID=A0A167KI37_9GAMM|nr:hypothetical protein [Pseudoalteromonas luteoviolacea]KZN62830.1 hypothetical protein N473_18115 [Pseudoalteromonas luteoviolacea CPMOR-1]
MLITPIKRQLPLSKCTRDTLGMGYADIHSANPCSYLIGGGARINRGVVIKMGSGDNHHD